MKRRIVGYTMGSSATFRRSLEIMLSPEDLPYWRRKMQAHVHPKLRKLTGPLYFAKDRMFSGLCHDVALRSDKECTVVRANANRVARAYICFEESLEIVSDDIIGL